MSILTVGSPAAQRQFQVSVSGIPGYFAQMKGGEMASASTKVWDGGVLRPDNIAAPAMLSDLTLTRPYRPTQHRELVRQLRQGVGSLRLTITVVDLDENLDVLGIASTYPNSLLAGANRPDADAASGASATWDLMFALTSEV